VASQAIFRPVLSVGPSAALPRLSGSQPLAGVSRERNGMTFFLLASSSDEPCLDVR
jgi:hypothetical protein